VDAAGEAVADMIEARLRTGRPHAAAEWIEEQEKAAGRPLRPARPGPKPQRAAGNGNWVYCPQNLQNLACPQTLAMGFHGRFRLFFKLDTSSILSLA
jgi:hypothetical protein